jgi:dTDP-4-dehydrorhamnose reductase
MKKILIFGGSGLVGSRFIELHKGNFYIKAPSAAEVDITNPDDVLKVLEEFDCDCVVNFAAYTSVEEAEKDKDNKDGLCFKINVLGAKNIALVCKRFDKHLVHISTEYVFDGQKSDSPYTEDDKPNPLNWYGKTKYLGELAVLEKDAASVIVRISMPYSARYELKKDVARFFLEQLKLGNHVKAISDQKITPTIVSDIANALAVILEKQSTGIYHVSSKDFITPLEFVEKIARVFGLDNSIITSVGIDEYNKTKKAKLLKYSWLNPNKFENEFGGHILHNIDEGLNIFKKDL